MAYVRANLFYERESWKKPLWYSVGFHSLLVLAIIVTAFVYGHRPVNNWGMNNGQAVQATLVSASSLPIPHAEQSNNIVANESKGVTETKPEPKPVETNDGVTIPGHVTKPKEVKKVTPPTPTRPPRPEPTPETAVPYGEGGPVSGPYGAFTAPHTQGGFSFQNADFGSRFAPYVRIVNQTVSRNWYKPDVSAPRRAYITFDILRNGSVPFNSVQVEQSSGVPSLDDMAKRAVQRSEFPPLPDGYNGSKVSVEFWFDYQK
jgi:periplasmic protein TonB